MLRIWKYLPLLVLFDGTEGRPAREADKGTVSEVVNENASDAMTYSPLRSRTKKYFRILTGIIPEHATLQQSWAGHGASSMVIQRSY